MPRQNKSKQSRLTTNGSKDISAKSATESSTLNPPCLTLYEMDEYNLVFKRKESAVGRFTWCKDGTEISSRYISDTGKFEQTLVIPKVDFSDAGEYRVKGSNVDLAAILAVKPQISRGKAAFVQEPPNTIEKFEDEECSLPYKFSERLSDVNFFKGKTRIPESRIQVIESAVGVWNLMIQKLKKSDSGKYHAECQCRGQQVLSTPTILVVKPKMPAPQKRRRDVQGFLSNQCLHSLSTKIHDKDRVPLGIHLGFSNGEISHFKNANPTNLQLQIYDMLVGWRDKQKTKGETQVRSLGEQLMKVGRTDLKRKLFADHNLAYAKKKTKK